VETNGHEFVLWLALFAYGLHVLEEHSLNWQAWAQHALGIPVSWADFYVTNAIVVVGGICAAMVGWRLPEVSLAFPALALVNAVLFHIGPTVRQRLFSPGLLTAVILFLPVGTCSYYGAYLDGVLSVETVVVSVVGGGLLMAFPLVLFRIKGRLPTYEK
jgi:hypothetical protein